ncbi:hypothetical protein [Geodermatophilus sp. SYSU D00815]
MTVLRVEWLPGSDRLSGTCSCGARAEGDDPVAMWEWLQAHPNHPEGGAEAPAPSPLPAPPAHVVTDPARVLDRAPVLV